MKKRYSETPVGNSTQVVEELLAKHFSGFSLSADDVHYTPYGLKSNIESTALRAGRGTKWQCPAVVKNDMTPRLAIDFNQNGNWEADETTEGLNFQIPADAATGRAIARLALNDGTEINFTLIIADPLTEPRTISVSLSEEQQGDVTINGQAVNTLTTIDDIVLVAKSRSGFAFEGWENAAGEIVSKNPVYHYYGAQDLHLTARFGVDAWSRVPQNKPEWEVIRRHGQYVESFTLEQNGKPATPIYTAAECPQNLFVTIPHLVEAPAGSGFTVGWNDPNGTGLSYCRLSAYIDLNHDGDFDDANEFLKVLGTKNDRSAELSRGSIRVLLPADASLGITRLRLRFDSAWIGGWDPKTDAKPAYAETKRMVYDIPVEITDLPKQVSDISVVSAQPRMGTVIISGLGVQAMVNPGERVILQAQPQTGHEFIGWKDQYGRTVSTEANYGFVPKESGVFTAHFSKFPPKFVSDVNQGNWYFLSIRGKYWKAGGNQIVLQDTKTDDDEYLFKFVGTDDDFQIFSKTNPDTPIGIAKVTNGGAVTIGGGNTRYVWTATQTGSSIREKNTATAFLNDFARQNRLCFWMHASARDDDGSSVDFEESLVAGIAACDRHADTTRRHPVCDLRGRRVSHLHKGGLYVKDGKKLMSDR